MSLQKLFYKGLTPELVEKAEKELNETQKVKEEALYELRKLIKEEHKYINCSLEDEFLLIFLRCKKFDVKKSMNVLRNYINLQQKYSGLYTCRSTYEIGHMFRMNCMFVQPYRLKDLSHIGHIRLAKFDPSGDAVEKMTACVLAFANIILEYEVSQISGLHVLVDFADTTFRQYRAFVTISFIRFIVSCLLDTIPLRIKGVHFVHEPSVVHHSFHIFKHLVSKKLVERMHFHGSDLNSLHAILPKEYLPEWLGGTASPVDSDEVEAFFCSHEYMVEKWKNCKIAEKKT